MSPKSKQTSTRKRLSREEWLAHALDHLAHEGESKLTIDRVVKALRVTKGSFYWHFKDRRDFLLQMVEYWDEHFTTCVARHIESLDTSPADRLWAVAEAVWHDDLSRYDLAVRAWAAQDETVAKRVKGVDQERFAVVRGLFHDLGFREMDLEMRSRCFVTFISLERAILIRQSKKKRLECFKYFQSLITASAP